MVQARRYGSRSVPSAKPLFPTAVPPLQNGLAVEAKSAISGAKAAPAVLRICVCGGSAIRPTSAWNASVVPDRSSRRKACFTFVQLPSAGFVEHTGVLMTDP